jgi:phosphoribosylaminoimidazole-succinocarboxamide synthase
MPLSETSFNFTGQTGFYRGKVREVYEINNKYLVMIASDRISAFDHILPRAIPCKGTILNTLAAGFLDITKDVAPNWLINVPDPRVSIGYKCEAFPVEMVIRGYLCGHALRLYVAGKREICGVTMPEGMKPYDAFPGPLITPTTKAKEGHDEDISREEIISKGLVSEADYRKLEEYTRKLYAKGVEYAFGRGLVLADTKYEFGSLNGQITLIDEIHTPDSSRYFYKDSLESSGAGNELAPKQLSKEFVREWLMENGFQGREGESIPEMTDEVVDGISRRYLELYQAVAGSPFDPSTLSNEADLKNRIEISLRKLP